ncbi:MFS transporter [Metabacillus halosaccharovorans]|uniref:MFS transporter n=1 Tax=Metabacillus halosaccharovorans TaxID=930124 RepID=UPI00204019FB|nr:MFS transporter [Metabacillus halosaccharovorans]MCM3444268.1 MFS transporter [Metabacillus halosaccharovorans]
MNSKAITPFPRLIAGISIANFGYIVGAIVPIALLLTMKLAMLDPENVTKNFSIVSIVSALVGIAGLYLAGYISDRTSWKFGRRRTWILIGALTGGAALYMVGAAQSVVMVCVTFAIAKFLLSFIMSSVYGLIPDQVDESKRGTASGIIGIISPLGIMLGINVMLIFNSWSIESKFLLLGLVVIVSAIISCILVKEEQVIYQKQKQTSESVSFGQKLARIYPSPRKYPNYSLGLLTRFFMAIGYAASTYTSVYYLEHFGVSPENLTHYVSTSMNITVPLLAIFSILGGFLSDKVGRQKPFIYSSALVTAIGIIGFGFSPSITISYIAAAVISMGFGMFLAVDIALMTRVLPNKEDAGKDMGIVNIANDIGAPFANSIASPLVSAGGYPLFFGVLSIFAILAGAVVKPIPELEVKEEDDDLLIAK